MPMFSIHRVAKVAVAFGGYTFWFLAFWLFLGFLGLKSCKGACYNEVVQRIPSPSGGQVAVVTIGDCGGATTDFFGSVSVESSNPRLEAERLFGFKGRPGESGLVLEWANDTELIISVDSLAKVRGIYPEGRKSADLKVDYQFRHRDQIE